MNNHNWKKHKMKSLACIKLKIAFVFIFTVGIIDAQDIHFSLFNSAPLFINPANTGNFVGDWRASLNFRNQWGAIEAFNTSMAGFDKKIYIKGQNLGVGGYIMNDQSGSNKLSFTKVYASIAYRTEINKNHLNGGIQLGFVHGAYGSNFSEPSDWDPYNGVFAPSDKALEKKNYLDLNVGFSWKKSIRIFEPEAGISISHLNNPNNSFFEGKEKLSPRLLIHSKVKTKFGDLFYLSPAVMFTSQNGAKETMLGTNAGYNIMGNRSRVKELFAGVYFRNGMINNPDALSLVAGVLIYRVELAVCYDYNVSKLKIATNSRAAFEISILYRSISTVLNSYSIPCERF
jgi:type IX secretion system PorP/SprF family membrane protein